METPKVFWKYFDLYRRKQITIQEYSNLSGLSKREIALFLKELAVDKKVMNSANEGDIIAKNTWRT